MSDNESEESKRLSKKRKASRACDRCNTQHQPCDNASPKCGVCERVGAECTYDRPIRKRGPRAGYTAQYGERLWGLVLQENPEIEDLVLKVLRDTHGDTGVSNADFFKDNDHHSQLVQRFNDSRIGKFVKNGELAQSPATESSQTSTPNPKGTGEVITKPSSSKSDGKAIPVNNGDKSAPKPATSGIGSLPAITNLYGAPQNPRDIYILRSELTTSKVPSSTEPTATTHPLANSFSQDSTQASDWQICPSHAPTSVNAPSPYNHFTPYNSPRTNQGNGSMGPTGFSPAPNVPLPRADGADVEFDISDTNQWYGSGSIPADTLLNLGFTAGEGMTQDFLDFCENPDPIDNSAMSPIDQNEDEETVWRRLVMRGRFI